MYTAVFQPQRRSVAEKFQPRRTAFVYELDDDEDGLDIPTTLYRSKADCPKACLSSKQAANLKDGTSTLHHQRLCYFLFSAVHRRASWKA